MVLVTGDLLFWPVRPMAKVFADEGPDRHAVDAVPMLISAGNGHEDFQVAVTARCRLTDLAVTATAPGGPDGTRLPAPLVRQVGTVPVRLDNVAGSLLPCPAGEVVRRSPGDFPDPLLPRMEGSLDAGATRSYWLTLTVPEGVPAGVYRGEVTAHAGRSRASIPFAVEVLPYSLPSRAHMWSTHWFGLATDPAQSGFHGVRPWSPEFWRLLGNIARNMAEHRQNVFSVFLFDTITGTLGRDGEIRYDYSNFDRWVQTFLDAGLERIEGMHLAAGIAPSAEDPNLYTYSHMWVYREDDGRLVDPLRLWAGGEAFRHRTGDFLARLRLHLIEKGWLDRFLIHVADEPWPAQMPLYREIAALVKQAIPEAKRIEAVCQGVDMVDCVDVWVPIMHMLSDFHRERQRLGEELWWYTACMPRDGRYPNSFVDYHLIKTRVIPWLTYANGLSGYLRWSYDYYGTHLIEDLHRFVDPWQDCEAGGQLPPGDAYVVYPGDGLSIVDSIRWETWRAGMEDYEYLWLLGNLAGERCEAGQALDEALARVTPSVTGYTDDAQTLLDRRAAVARAVANLACPGG